MFLQLHFLDSLTTTASMYYKILPCPTHYAIYKRIFWDLVRTALIGVNSADLIAAMSRGRFMADSLFLFSNELES